MPLAGGDEHLPKTVREFRQKYKGVSRILDQHPEIVEAAHEDLKRLSHGGSKGRGGGWGRKERSGDFTSETILRALIVHAIEGGSFRETEVRIGESEFLQDFVRTRKKATLEYTSWTGASRRSVRRRGSGSTSCWGFRPGKRSGSTRR